MQVLSFGWDFLKKREASHKNICLNITLPYKLAQTLPEKLLWGLIIIIIKDGTILSHTNNRDFKSHCIQTLFWPFGSNLR